MFVEFEIDVDDLVDYNELGANPTVNKYQLRVNACVNKVTLETSDIEIFDYAHKRPVIFVTLSDKDQRTLIGYIELQAVGQISNGGDR